MLSTQLGSIHAGCLLKSLALAVGGALLLGAATSLYIIIRLPDIEALRDVRLQIPLRVYSHDGVLMGEFGEKRRVPVLINEVPPQLVQAFIAAEDDQFFKHPGVDWRGLLRASIALARTGEKRQGGSTITMQVARNFFLTREKSYARKLNEIFLALKIESELNKNEILELYLNKIYLGQRAYGVGAAAQVYYGAELDALNLAQQAMLAGLPKAPSRTNPVSNPEQAAQRRAYVLRRMLELGFIRRDAYEEAVAAPVTAALHSPGIGLEAPYAAEMVRRRMVEEYGEAAYSAGYAVTTTIRAPLQAAANKAVRRTLTQYDERHGYRGPERRLAPAAGETEEQWTQRLSPFVPVADLAPALVVRVQGFAATAWLGGAGGLIEIGWDGMSWARAWRSVNQRGAAPANAADVVSVGDVIRVRKDAAGNWRLAQLPDIEGALVSLDPGNGAALALVGGFDFYQSNFNRAVQAERQPGSSLKPFIYSAALEHGYTPASIINDAPVVYGDPAIGARWKPENYSGKTFGPTRLRVALRHSRNLVSIRLLHAVGVYAARRHLAKFGFDDKAMPENLSLALGSGVVTPWRLAAAYAVFANGGYRVEPFLIERIETRRGELLFQADPATVCVDCAAAGASAASAAPAAPAAASYAADDFRAADPYAADPAPLPAAAGNAVARRVIAPENAWIMNQLTRDVVRRGTGARIYRELKRDDLGGKTGTTNEQRDAWFAGFSPALVAVAWVGFDDFKPMGTGETGSRTALPLWLDYMKAALRDVPPAQERRPAGIVTLRINKDTGCPAGADDANAAFEIFAAGRLPDAAECGRPNAAYGGDKGEAETLERLF